MITVTAAEATRDFSAVLDKAERGAAITIVRDGEPIAVLNPPLRPNGAAIIKAYSHRTPAPEPADALEEAHRIANVPIEVTGPWPDS